MGKPAAAGPAAGGEEKWNKMQKGHLLISASWKLQLMILKIGGEPFPSAGGGAQRASGRAKQRWARSELARELSLLGAMMKLLMQWAELWQQWHTQQDAQ